MRRHEIYIVRMDARRPRKLSTDLSSNVWILVNPIALMQKYILEWQEKDEQIWRTKLLSLLHLMP